MNAYGRWIVGLIRINQRLQARPADAGLLRPEDCAKSAIGQGRGFVGYDSKARARLTVELLVIEDAMTGATAGYPAVAL